MTRPRQLQGTAKSRTSAFIPRYQAVQGSRWKQTLHCLIVNPGSAGDQLRDLGQVSFSVPQFLCLCNGSDRPHFKKVVVKIVFIYAKHYRSVSYCLYYQTTFECWCSLCLMNRPDVSVTGFYNSIIDSFSEFTYKIGPLVPICHVGCCCIVSRFLNKSP